MRRSLITAGVLFVIWLVLLLTSGAWATWFWFDSLGLTSVLWMRYTGPLVLGLAATLLAGLFAGLNLLVASRQVRGEPRYIGQQLPIPPALNRLIVVVAATAIAVVLGMTAAPEWEEVLLAVNAPAFGVSDPLFGMDVGFYVFRLPLLEAGRGWLIQLIVLVAAAVVGLYALRTGMSARYGRLNVPPGLRTHLAFLGGLLLLALALGSWIDAFELVYARRGAVYGAGYADATAQLLAYRLLLGISLLAAAGMFIFMISRRLLVLIAAAAVWPLAALLVGQLYPSAVQTLVVRPNELNLEAPYLEDNIRMTRAAFGLDRAETRELSGQAALTADDLRASSETVNNLRLWDYRPLLATLAQTQEIRLYYSFVDVDVDRYVIDGRYRQVHISARELDQSKLSPQARTWQNLHLVYTHGYGVVVTAVNEVRSEGLPRYLLENIPPAGAPELTPARPQIYFGEKTDTYVFVRTLPGRPGEEPEFDYPLGDTNATTTYAGRDGVALDSPLKRLVMAFYFGDGNALFSRNFTDETRALFHRNVPDRIKRLAPFLALDRDPYLTVVDGRLVWIQDAYTSTNRYPYATPTATERFGRVNYVRNPVKATVDAYDGTVTLYVVDETEPILAAYRALYPALFTPLSEASPALRAHFRYPEDLFEVQSAVFTTYHMQNSQIFYNREDAWALPQMSLDGQVQPMEAYNVVMSLPEAQTQAPEFMLMRPFTPLGKSNMVAWMVGRADGGSYGTLRVYAFPKDRVLFGPQQIEARIDQEPEISQQLTLWNQSGSQVIRGNLLVVPMRETLLYVQPLYLQAENSRLPELKRVIVASSERVVMGTDLASALERLVGSAPGNVVERPAPPVGQPAAPGPVTDAGALARQAREHYRRAQEALQRGDWAGYGAALKELEAALDRLAGGP